MPTKQWTDTKPISWAYTQGVADRLKRQEQYEKLLLEARKRGCLDLVEIALKINSWQKIKSMVDFVHIKGIIYHKGE